MYVTGCINKEYLHLKLQISDNGSGLEVSNNKNKLLY